MNKTSVAVLCMLAALLAVFTASCANASFGLGEPMEEDSETDSEAEVLSDVAETGVTLDGGADSADAPAETAVETSVDPDADAPTDTAETSTPDSALEAKPDAGPETPEYPPPDPCKGVGAPGEVVLGICKPMSGDPGYLGVALRVLYPSGTITPNEEWKNPWLGAGCSASKASDCTCCAVRPTSGAPMPKGSDIDFKAGTSTTVGAPISTIYAPSGVGAAHYYGYWGPTLVGRATGGAFDSTLTALRPPPSWAIGNVLFHY